MAFCQKKKLSDAQVFGHLRDWLGFNGSYLANSALVIAFDPFLGRIKMWEPGDGCL